MPKFGSLAGNIATATLQSVTAGRRTTGKAQQQTSVKTEAGKVVSVDKAAKKALLSFGEEMEVEDAMGSDFSLANSTHRK